MKTRSLRAKSSSASTKPSRFKYTSEQSTSAPSQSRSRRSLKARDSRESSLSGLKAMPRTPHVTPAKLQTPCASSFLACSSTQSGMVSLTSMAAWPKEKVCRQYAASCMVSLKRHGPAVKPERGKPAARGYLCMMAVRMRATGFEQATLVPTRGPAQSQLGWARFSTVEAAQAAVQQLNGRPLTEEQSPEGIVLTADFARSNYRPNPTRKRPAPGGTLIHPPPAVAVPPPHVPPPGPRISPPAPPVAQGRPPCCTLFLGGLPEGCTEQELYTFFSTQCAGFERMKFVAPGDGGRPGMAFAKFISVEYAEAALQTILAGVALPSCPSFQLQAEYAKHELDQPSGAPRLEAPPPPVPQYVPQHVVEVPRSADGTTPCDTMFVGCLPPTVTEQELAGALMMMPGFVRTKLCGQGQPRPVAFALFDSVESCSQAMNALHGTALPSAPHQPITCEFSKNSLDKRQRVA